MLPIGKHRSCTGGFRRSVAKSVPSRWQTYRASRSSVVAAATAICTSVANICPQSMTTAHGGSHVGILATRPPDYRQAGVPLGARKLTLAVVQPGASGGIVVPCPEPMQPTHACLTVGCNVTLTAERSPPFVLATRGICPCCSLRRLFWQISSRLRIEYRRCEPHPLVPPLHRHVPRNFRAHCKPENYRMRPNVAMVRPLLAQVGRVLAKLGQALLDNTKEQARVFAPRWGALLLVVPCY